VAFEYFLKIDGIPGESTERDPVSLTFAKSTKL
jgi:hypothetical protein